MIKSVLITGASGLIGTRLTEILLQNGYQVRHLGRSVATRSGVQGYRWDITEGHADPAAFEGVSHVVHLAGAGVADARWTASRKREILESRTQSTLLLHKMLAQHGKSVQALVSASAVGFYGLDTGERLMHEHDEAGVDFLASVTRQWEGAVDGPNSSVSRIVKLRIGVVLSERGGAWPKLAQTIRYGLGAALGTGEQWMSWIHLDDLCEIFRFALENETLSGTFNAVAPAPVTNGQFNKIAARVLHRPLWLPNVPSWTLRLALGEMSGMILGGNRVSSEAIENAGFNFEFPDLEDALTQVAAHSR
ncbi:MAG: TIGR01777 family oxidoreductase [Cyclobacteriaceae bacterium]|nr:TIGR01777 family oxidoreductase [Cyclobacteriaceae bacterium]